LIHRYVTNTFDEHNGRLLGQLLTRSATRDEVDEVDEQAYRPRSPPRICRVANQHQRLPATLRNTRFS
jgi:hypothetical protein